MVRAVCSRSQGQSRRSCSVSCWSSSSASARATSARGRRLRRGSSRRLVADLVLRLLGEVLLRVVPPARHLVLLLLLQELLLDGRLDLVERNRGCLRRRLHRPERL